MSESALADFVAGLEPRFAPMVTELDRAIREAAPELESRISYQMLTYTLGKDRRAWVCAIGATKKTVALRFLYGMYLADPGKLLRPGTSTLSTIDYAAPEQLDADVVAAYVRDAVEGHAGFKIRDQEARQARG